MLAALAHGLDVIEFLAGERGPALLGAVATAIGMSKGGTHRILTTLVARGFVVRAEGGVYSLGYKAWEIGWAVPGVQMVPRAVPVMQQLADEIGDGAILGTLDAGFEVVYLHVIESRQPVRVYIDVGSRLPANVTSTGLALLAWLPSERLDAILPKKLPQWASETITDRAALLRELEKSAPAATRRRSARSIPTSAASQRRSSRSTGASSRRCACRRLAIGSMRRGTGACRVR